MFRLGIFLATRPVVREAHPITPPEWVSKYTSRNQLTKFQFMIPPEVVEQYSPIVQRLLSIELAPQKERTKAAYDTIVERFSTLQGKSKTQAASIAKLTVEINRQAERALACRRSHFNYLRANELLARRRGLLRRLRDEDFEAYWDVVNKLGLHDALGPRTRLFKKRGQWYRHPDAMFEKEPKNLTRHTKMQTSMW